MNRFAAAAAVVLLAFPGLASSSPAGPTTPVPKKGVAAPTSRGKAQAPVDLTTELRTDGATVTVRFLSAARGVTIEARGLDGLTVTSSANVLSGGRFARGESAQFDVTFAKGPGRSQLVVSVSGRFGPATRSLVASFPIGEASAEQQKASGSATTDSTGRRLKILPAEAR